MLHQSRVYSTSDTALAAYLITEGFGQPSIQRTQKECVFCFSLDGQDIGPFVKNYDSGKATTNAYMFYHNYKKLLERVHRA